MNTTPSRPTPTGGDSSDDIVVDPTAELDDDDALEGIPVPLDVDFDVPTEDALEQLRHVPDEEDAWEHR